MGTGEAVATMERSHLGAMVFEKADLAPYLSSCLDRHGGRRWWFRRSGRTVSLPGTPGEPQFEEAYSAAVEERERREVQVVGHPGAAVPKSFKSAWRRVRQSAEWSALDEEWIEMDPSYKISWRPEYKGFRAWTEDELLAFEDRWEIGTTPRLVYSLALWLGNRSSVTTIWNMPSCTAGRRSRHACRGKR